MMVKMCEVHDDIDLKRMLIELELQLKEVEEISVEEIARKVKKIGFRCQRCGDCCRGGDNNVLVFPFEIRRIICQTGENWLEMAEPPIDGEWDEKGNFHTLEWRLKKADQNCRYHSQGRCRIYDNRPLLCQTYPFYLDGRQLHWSECRGLNKPIEFQESMNLASLIKKRRIIEVQEAIKLISKYMDFKRGLPSRYGLCVIHDSEGEHEIKWSQLRGMLDRCIENTYYRSIE